MNKLKIYLTLAASLVVSLGFGQSLEDLYSLSFKSRVEGTARSAAMGGAFTSLGANLSSININPAGLGMYRSSQVGMTLGLHTSSNKTEVFDNVNNTLYDTFKNNKVTFRAQNYGAVINLLHNPRSSGLVSFNVGFSLESTSSSEIDYYVESPSTNISIGDYFAGQLLGVNSDLIGNDGAADKYAIYRNSSTSLWGGIMAYNNFVVSPVANTTSYSVDPRTLLASDYVNPQQRMVVTSSTDNMMVSAGANISNYLYIGASLGSRIFSLSRMSDYQEYGVDGNVGELDNLTYIQRNHISGSAFDFKIGATIEPIVGLKFGVAYHAPTITTQSVVDELSAEMYTDYTNGDNYYQETPYDVLEYNLKSPQALLLGVSYTMSRAILSFDYQKSWYNSIEVSDMLGADDVNDMISNNFKATDSYMMGAEFRATRELYLRGGYAIYGSPYESKELDEYLKMNTLSLGVGYSNGNVALDFAYINSSYSTIPMLYYSGYFFDPLVNSDVIVESPSEVFNRVSQGIYALTLTIRF